MIIPFSRAGEDLDEPQVERSLIEEGLSLLNVYRSIESRQKRAVVVDFARDLSREESDTVDVIPSSGGSLEFSKAVLKLARIGAVDPKSLSRGEVESVCHALVIHYAQMGIE